MTHVTTRIIRGMLALGLCAAAAACGNTSSGNVVTILVPWEKGSAEYQDFYAVISTFDAKNGIVANIESTRALSQDLDADIAANDQPDLVDLSSPAALAQYKSKGLRALTIDLGSYYQPWRNLAQLGTGTAYAVPVKADITSLIWYRKNPPPTQLPTSLSTLERISGSGTWCLGLASSTASGWPGADWIANVLLTQQNASTYESWLTGAVPWTSDNVKGAWNEWGKLMRGGISGGAANALKTPFNDAATEENCQFERGALAATRVSTADYDFVQFPPLSGENPPLMVAGDFMGLFTENPSAEKLLAYLASKDAQKAWVNPDKKLPNGYAFSADSELKPADYPAGVEQRIAGLLQTASANRSTLCFDTDDMLVPDMSTAFQQAVLDYVDYFDAGHLSTLLSDLQATQNGSGQRGMAALAKDACTNTNS